MRGSSFKQGEWRWGFEQVEKYFGRELGFSARRLKGVTDHVFCDQEQPVGNPVSSKSWGGVTTGQGLVYGACGVV